MLNPFDMDQICLYNRYKFRHHFDIDFIHSWCIVSSAGYLYIIKCKWWVHYIVCIFCFFFSQRLAHRVISSSCHSPKEILLKNDGTHTYHAMTKEDRKLLVTGLLCWDWETCVWNLCLQLTVHKLHSLTFAYKCHRNIPNGDNCSFQFNIFWGMHVLLLSRSECNYESGYWNRWPLKCIPLLQFSQNGVGQCTHNREELTETQHSNLP
jgi:hypothetical protein